MVQIRLDGTARVISDLHLQAGHELVNTRFAAFLSDCHSRSIQSLFILGDLFEYWIGDDSGGEPFNRWVALQLRALSQSGTRIFFVAGNRDFLLGDTYAQMCGMVRLDDPVRVDAGGTATLLMHGDTLCTDDLAYQEFRTTVRSPAWAHNFLAQPLSVRVAQVTQLRQRSQQAMQEKSADIMDVNAATVADTMARHTCDRLIHGHTHRPAMHRHEALGRLSERWVLSDWTDKRADALELEGTQIQRLNLV